MANMDHGIALRPEPLFAYHFTHIDHLATVITRGLLSDSVVQNDGALQVEVGNQGVKQRRRERRVPVGPGGVVADYVPFYFCARNLMLYQIHTGKVETYAGGQSNLVFLRTSLERIAAMNLSWAVSNRNAATELARFVDTMTALDGHVDWELACASNFNRTETDPERPHRHQAELLVHGTVPWQAIDQIGCFNADVLARVEELVARATHRPDRAVRPGWYF